MFESEKAKCILRFESFCLINQGMTDLGVFVSIVLGPLRCMFYALKRISAQQYKIDQFLNRHISLPMPLAASAPDPCITPDSDLIHALQSRLVLLAQKVL